MLKTGIYRLGQLDASTAGGFFGRRRFIAASLYPAVAASGAPDRDVLLERILLRFAASNGIYKRTGLRRFEALDAQLAGVIRERFDGGARVAVHDLAVSDGRTAVELFTRLAGIDGIILEFVASDATPDVLAIRAPAGALELIIDPRSFAPLQLIRPPFVFNVHKPESAALYPVNRLLLWALLRTEVPRLLRRLDRGDPQLTVRSIRLLAPDCLRLLETDPRFSFVRHDILQPMDRAFQVVRAMNILNRSYFSDAQLRRVRSHVWDALEPEGLFVTGSNEGAGSEVEGGVYERTDAGFRRLWASGSGSQVDDLIRTPRPSWRSADDRVTRRHP